MISIAYMFTEWWQAWKDGWVCEWFIFPLSPTPHLKEVFKSLWQENRALAVGAGAGLMCMWGLSDPSCQERWTKEAETRRGETLSNWSLVSDTLVWLSLSFQSFLFSTISLSRGKKGGKEGRKFTLIVLCAVTLFIFSNVNPIRFSWNRFIIAPLKMWKQQFS